MLKRSGTSGFGLLELLITVLIVGIGLASLVYILSQAIVVNTESSEKTVASLLCAEAIELYRNASYADIPVTGGWYNDPSLPDPSYPKHYRRWQISQAGAGLKKVEAEVAVHSMNSANRVEMAIYRADY